MNIIVDDREQRAGIVELLEKSGNRVTLKRLLIGDYIVDGRIVVERKTANDFVTSIIQGRLFKQICTLRKVKLRSVLIIEGDPYRTERGISAEAVRGTLVSIAVVWQVPVIFSSSRENTVKQMRMMSEQVADSSEVMPLRGGYRPKRLINRQLFIIQGLPGVGARLAWRLLSHFRCVARVFSASVDALIEVRGVGTEKARRIRRVLELKR